MDCPRCGAPMEIMHETKTKSEMESDKAQKYRCLCCNYATK